MAISHDADAVSTDQTASPITWNHTIGVGTNTFLAVGVSLNGTVSAPTATGVTYGGVSMTKMCFQVEDGATDHMEASIWFLKKPLGGTNQVSVTFTGGTSPHGAGGSSSYFGCLQLVNTAYGSAGGSTGTASGDQGFTLTTPENNCWWYAIAINTATTSPTLTISGTPGTQRITQTLGNTQSGIMVTQDPNGSTGAAGSPSYRFNFGGTGLGGWATCAFPFAPDVYSGQTLSNYPPYVQVGGGMSRNERAS